MGSVDVVDGRRRSRTAAGRIARFLRVMENSESNARRKGVIAGEHSSVGVFPIPCSPAQRPRLFAWHEDVAYLLQTACRDTRQARSPKPQHPYVFAVQSL